MLSVNYDAECGASTRRKYPRSSTAWKYQLKRPGRLCRHTRQYEKQNNSLVV